MKKQLIECVPNISEGRDIEKVNAIANSVTSVEGVKLLNIDSGKDANRTVITFVGEPKQVVEAAYRLIKKAGELIDMSKQTGEHPRFGATDVCPLIPISNITMKETIKYAYLLGMRVGNTLGIPVYFYEHTATEEKRKNLANCRSGEYEGLKQKLTDSNWKPDVGPSQFNNTVAKTGAVAISARDFLIAYNINLNTSSTKIANSIASEIRESGRIKREGNKKITDTYGNPVRIKGKLKAVKGIGWYIKEYGIAQVSYNITNINTSPIHLVFEETKKSASDYNVQVTGSELIGLIPLQPMINAADYFLKKQGISSAISEEDKVKIAVKSLGLNDLKPFNPKNRIIEYLLNI